MNRRLIALLAASAVLPCLAAGCGNPTVVNGNVTYEGNNTTVALQPGQQTLDFHLKRPAAR